VWEKKAHGKGKDNVYAWNECVWKGINKEVACMEGEYTKK
jgi:hypothetical protein